MNTYWLSNLRLKLAQWGARTRYQFRQFIRRFGKEKQTCKSRLRDWGPWERGYNLDYWRVNPDGTRTCSFCGSLHPEDFEKLLDRALETKDVDIDPSTKGGKWYVIRPEVKSASDGGIKYKSGHNLDSVWCERVDLKLKQAVKESWERFEAKLNGTGVEKTSA